MRGIFVRIKKNRLFPFKRGRESFMVATLKQISIGVDQEDLAEDIFANLDHDDFIPKFERRFFKAFVILRARNTIYTKLIVPFVVNPIQVL